jgi:flagellar basal body-associated protein FliL
MIELLIAATLTVIVVGVAMLWIVSSLKQENQISSRSAATRQAEVGLERLTRDLRQVVPNSTTAFTWGGTSASTTFTIPTSGTGGASSQQITWTCSFGDTGFCTRSVNSGTAVSEISNVESVVFAPVDASGNALTSGSGTQAVYVGVTLQVLDASQLDTTRSHQALQVRKCGGGVTTSCYTLNPITVADGVDLRGNSL